VEETGGGVLQVLEAKLLLSESYESSKALFIFQQMPHLNTKQKTMKIE